MRRTFALFALAMLALCLCASADPSVDALVAKGDAASAAKHYKEAIVFFEQAEKATPNAVTVLLKLSRAYSDLLDESDAKADGDRSLAYAKRALALAPENAQAHLSVAIGYGKLTDYVGNKTKLEYSRILKDEVEKSIALDPRDSFAWYMLGRWHFGVANVNGILKMLARVVYGGLPPASNEEALRCLRKAVELAPQELMHHSALARVYTEMGKTAEAKEEWRTVLKLKAKTTEEQEDQKEAKKVLGM